MNRLERQSYSVIQNLVVIQTRSHQRDYLTWGSKNAQCGHNKHTVKQNTGSSSVKHQQPPCSLAALTKRGAASWICVPGVQQHCLCPAWEHCCDTATHSGQTATWMSHLTLKSLLHSPKFTSTVGERKTSRIWRGIFGEIRGINLFLLLVRGRRRRKTPTPLLVSLANVTL